MLDKKLLLVVLLIVSITLCIGQQVHYQGTETDKNKQSKHNRQPIESNQCLEGEFLYPGDNEKDWVCDCKPIYAYHPESQKCYQVYEQGPCKNGEILILAPKKASPKCMRNQCIGRKVYFKGKCVNLNENGGCPKHLAVLIDSSTLQLTCALNINTRFDDDLSTVDEFATPLNFTTNPVDNLGSLCLLGGKRSQNDTCTTVPM